MSLSEICNQYEADHINSQVWKQTVTHGAISKKAKDKKWTKNLADRVKERVQEKLVTGLVTGCEQTEEEIISRAAEEPVRVAKGQRVRTARALQFQDLLFTELRDQFKDGQKESKKEGGKPVDVMGKVRAFKDLVVTVKALQDQQAEQYKLNSEVPKDETPAHVVQRTLADRLKDLDADE